MTAKTKPTEEFRMKEGEFDRLMGRALNVKPKNDKPKVSKAKAPKKKASR